MNAAPLAASLLCLCASARAIAAAPAPSGEVSLSPAVVELAGQAGQSTTQRLTLRNDARIPLSFALEARDVVVRDGRRALVPAGEIAASIAATAVFSERSVTVAPGSVSSITVTLTLPPGLGHRAAVVLFRGTTRLGDGRVASTASLGALLTFNLSGRVSLDAAELRVTPPSGCANALLEETVVNDGAEPVVPRGAGVLLDATGTIAARVTFEPRRVLPGERVVLSAEHAGELPPGRYRVVATFEYDGRSLTRTAELAAP